jgi:hypothetical protein
MGTTLSRQDEDEHIDIKFGKDPFRLIDRGRAGQVFVIAYHLAAPSPSTHPPSLHYSVVVDVSGESDDVLLVGKELTIDSDSSTGAFFDFRPLKGRWPLGKLVEVPWPPAPAARPLPHLGFSLLSRVLGHKARHRGSRTVPAEGTRRLQLCVTPNFPPVRLAAGFLSDQSTT